MYKVINGVAVSVDSIVRPYTHQPVAVVNDELIDVSIEKNYMCRDIVGVYRRHDFLPIEKCVRCGGNMVYDEQTNLCPECIRDIF